MKKLVHELSGVAPSAATDTEPDFGNWLGAGKLRKLGAEMSGRADVWYKGGGYTQTEFPQADDIWGGKFEDLTEFNLDPGIYRKSSQELMKIPKKWKKTPSLRYAKELEMPNTVGMDGEDEPSAKIIKKLDVKVPSYRDFF